MARKKNKKRVHKIKWGRYEDDALLRNIRLETEREGVKQPFDLSGSGQTNVYKRVIADLTNLGYKNLKYPQDRERIKQQYNTFCQPQTDASIKNGGLLRRKASLQTKYEMNYGVDCRTSTYKKESLFYKTKIKK